MIPKFKIWDKTENKMYYMDSMSYEVSIDHPRVVFEMPFEMVGYDWKNHDFELLQYTGLKDKNNVEIYEGNILKCVFNSDCHEDENLVIRWNPYSACFGLFHNMKKIDNSWGWGNIGLNPDRSNFKSFEVVGTIQENPELLEG